MKICNDIVAILESCTPEDLIEIINVARDIYTSKTKLEKKQKIKEFNVGDIVMFYTSNGKEYHEGNVIKVNIINLIVKVGLYTWTVPANIATKVPKRKG